MRILTINEGSSTLKCQLYDSSKNFHLLWQLSIKSKNLEEVIPEMQKLGVIDRVGHRIVHGGSFYQNSVIIDEEVKKNIASLESLAPLHQQNALRCIATIERVFKGVPQIAVFDTAFHHTMPKVKTIYPGPYYWYEEGIRRYGFHGISFQYASKRASELLGVDLSSLKMVVCHLGSGASLCAIDRGISIDTTMGYTPLEGLMMDTRSGSIDPGLLLALLKKKTPETLSRELYGESGLLGISGSSGGMQEIMTRKHNGDERAALAFNLYLHRLNSLIGSMVASLGGMDALVFTGGIGENTPLLRRGVSEVFLFLGTEIDEKKNNSVQEDDLIISSPLSKVKIAVIHAEEGLEIARECSIR